MKRFLTSAARIGGLATLSVSLAACDPDERVGSNAHYALAQTAFAPADAGYYPEVEALPLLPAATDYALAPSWDYAQSGYTDYTPTDPYAYGGYYEGDQGDYYDDGAGTETYAALALAALIGGLIGDSPPDYGFDYGGVRPWAWNTSDGYYRYAEPVQGGYRYYYYEPRAERPFLVRDPWYSYGYRDGRLAAIYDRDGRVLRQRAAVRQRLAAERYYDRAWNLRRAALADRHYGVSAPVWAQRRAVIAAEQRRWREARAERVAWQRWDARHEAELDRRWRTERAERVRAARQFDDWREQAYRGPAPRFYQELQRERAERMAEQRREQAQRLVQRQREQAQREAQQQRRAQTERLADQRRDQAERLADQRREQAQRLAEQRREQAQQQAQRERQAQQVRAQQARQEAAAREIAADRRQVAERREQAAAASRRQAAEARREAEARQQATRERAERRQQQQRSETRERQAQVQRAQQQAQARERQAETRRVQQQAQARERQAQAQRTQQAAEARRQQATAQREQGARQQARAEARRPAAARQRPASDEAAAQRHESAARRAARAERGSR